ncbi:MAG: hypothetical protein AB9873_04010 [Syntrophobacteraceae bacterium]
MEELSRSLKGRIAIRTFKITADALLLRGHYRISGPSGQTMESALRTLSPEIYGVMNDPRTIDLNGLEYVMDRLPRGIEQCSRIVLTAREDLESTSFERIVPPKRRRVSYRVGDNEMCFVITRGLSEIYDILTHLTFLHIEARKIAQQMRDSEGNPAQVWKELEQNLAQTGELRGKDLDHALWNLSLLLGRTFQETKEAYDSFETSRREHQANNGLLRLIWDLGKLMDNEMNRAHDLTMLFTPVLGHIVLNQVYGKKWAKRLWNTLIDRGLQERPLHIISANLHSVLNTLFAYAASSPEMRDRYRDDFYGFIQVCRQEGHSVESFASGHGFLSLPDESGTQIDCQLIDTAALAGLPLHPELRVSIDALPDPKPVILVMDYAFGTQAFEVMDELLDPAAGDVRVSQSPVRSISIMGKAGTICGQKGDIMLATAHVLEGLPHNYIVENDLSREDFAPDIDVHAGPIITVLGTSLQNRDVLERFQRTSWKAVGLEMEGGHYQQAISAAVIRGHIPRDVKVRYAYYASDNPLVSGQTLASGSMGVAGIRPTYMITKVILEKILGTPAARGEPAGIGSPSTEKLEEA